MTGGKDYYAKGDTIQMKLITQSLGDKLDTTFRNELDPALKEFSRELGKVLLEYGESDLDSIKLKEMKEK